MKMKKKFFLIGFISFIMLLGACGNATTKNLPVDNDLSTDIMDDTSNSTLEYKKEVYRNNEITISYPQISNSNSQLSDSMNQKMKDDALSVLDRYSGKLENLLLEINYSLELVENRIISICFEGGGYRQNAAHPYSLFYTINIDVSTGEKLTAEDLLELNEDLVESIKKNAKYAPCNGDTNEELVSAVNQELKDYDPNNMLADMEKSGIAEGQIYIYLTQNSLGISLPVAYAIGDYANFEVDYDYLSQYLKFKR